MAAMHVVVHGHAECEALQTRGTGRELSKRKAKVVAKPKANGRAKLKGGSKGAKGKGKDKKGKLSAVGPWEKRLRTIQVPRSLGETGPGVVVPRVRCSQATLQPRRKRMTLGWGQGCSRVNLG